MAIGGTAGMSLRRYLLIGILAPVLGFVVLNTTSLYRQALAAADTAYDRTLLASAKAIGELLDVAGPPDRPALRATLSYSALEAFEADNRSRIFYRVTGFDGEMVSGFADLPAPRQGSGTSSVYAALVRFYDDQYQGMPVRMAVLQQPVAGVGGQGMATIQVAETLELRRTLARSLLVQTLWQQLGLVALIAVVLVAVVQRATHPVRRLSDELRRRDEADLSPLAATGAPRELAPMVEATNAVMARLAHLLDHQKRFVRDASHQLRTPLAVLKAQVQSARRGDVEPRQALAEIAVTVERATELANQMLALAKVEQMRHQGDAPVNDWAALVRAVALDVGPLVADGGIDFEIATQPAPVRGHEWALRELTRNLLHNAIRHTPPGARLAVHLAVHLDVHLGAAGAVHPDAGPAHAELRVSDSGPGIGDELRQRLFQPFAAAGPGGGSGLGLAICREIVHTLGGSLQLVNRTEGGRVVGLDAVVTLALCHDRSPECAALHPAPAPNPDPAHDPAG